MDLFDDDKRLTLRPVAAFNELLAAAFANGKCTCIGCEERGGYPSKQSLNNRSSTAGHS